MKKGGKCIGIFADDGFYLSNSNIRSKLLAMPWKKKQLGISSALYPIEKIVQQLNKFQPDMLGGYPSNLELLIEQVELRKLKIQPVIIKTGGECLSESLRKRLSATFHCYVQTSYCCTEGGMIGYECQYHHFHINQDWLIVEPVDENGRPVSSGQQAEKFY